MNCTHIHTHSRLYFIYYFLAFKSSQYKYLHGLCNLFPGVLCHCDRSQWFISRALVYISRCLYFFSCESYGCFSFLKIKYPMTIVFKNWHIRFLLTLYSKVIIQFSLFCADCKPFNKLCSFHSKDITDDVQIVVYFILHLKLPFKVLLVAF